jgi:hypothetical protein
MTVPYTFGTATTSIPLSNLDANFNTPITLGNTSIYLGNTTTTIGNLTLTNATISSGTVNITNVTVTTANVTNITVTGTANIATGNITTLTSTSITDSGLTSGRVTYAGASGLLSDSANLTFSGTNLGVTGTAGALTDVATTEPLYINAPTTTTGAGAGIRFNVISGAKESVGVIGVVNNATGNLGSMTFHLYNAGADIPERMRLTNTGNLGLGVTPSAWRTTDRAFVIGSAGKGLSAPTSGNSIFLATNWYVSTSPANVYVGNGYATRYTQSDGVHTWSTAPNNTSGADALLNFTDAMTLDASGNLGIGETSPSSFGKLAVYGGAANTIVSIKTNSFDGTYYAGLNFSTGGQGANDPQAQIKAVGANNYSANLVFSTQNSGTTNPLAPRMTILSDGNVGINTNNPDYASYGATERILGVTGVATNRGRLSLQNTATGTTGAAGTIAFFNGSTLLSAIDVVADGATNQGLFDFNTNNGTTTTSRMRISSVGNVSIGTTSALNTGVFSVFAAASRQGSTFQATTDSYWPILCWNLSAGSTSLLLFQSGSGGATVGSITYNGSLTLYNTTSDQRLKTNIVDAPSGNIDDIKVRSFDWIENGNHQPYGMIAQELNEVAPYAVHQPQSPDEMMGVDYSKLVPMMIKEIQDLKQRIATLENK